MSGRDRAESDALAELAIVIAVEGEGKQEEPPSVQSKARGSKKEQQKKRNEGKHIPSAAVDNKKENLYAAGGGVVTMRSRSQTPSLKVGRVPIRE